MDLSAPALLKKLQAFRKTTWFDAILLIVLGFVAVGLFQFTLLGQAGICLGILLTPVSAFVIPYWLGERRIKRLALNIVPVLVIAVLVISALQTQAVMSQGPPDLSSGFPSNTPAANLPPLTLWNGTVVPYNTPSSNQTYAFHVRLKMAGVVNTSKVSVYLNITEIAGLSDNPPAAYRMVKDPGLLNANLTNGTWYVTWRPLTSRVYGFLFFATDGRGNATYSIPVLAPVLAPWGSYYFVWIVSVAEFMIYPGSFYFIILFMYWYTLRTRKLRTRMIEAKQKGQLDLDKEGAKESPAGDAGEDAKMAKPPAPPRDKTRKVAAFTCTNCGADVTEDDKKCPKCGAVFED